MPKLGGPVYFPIFFWYRRFAASDERIGYCCIDRLSRSQGGASREVLGNSRLVFSFVPACQGLRGSYK